MKPVLVVGDNAMAGLQTVRSLGRAGVPVELVAFESSRITRRSRYVRRVHDLGHPLRETATFLERFLSLVSSTDYQLALPTSDAGLIPLVQCFDQVKRHITVAAPPPNVFDVAHHKRLTVRLAQQLGIDVPATVFLPDEDQGQIEQLGFPLVLKPDCSLRAGRSRPAAVRVVHHRDGLDQLLPEMLADGDVLAQQYCPGFGRGIGVLADRGVVSAAFQYRRVHEPPAGGPSTYRVSEPLCEQLFSGVTAFCEAANWSGPAMFEYKVCPVSGRHVLMEVNGRMWGSIALAIKSGVDFPRLIYRQFAQGHREQVRSYRAPYYVRNVSRDLYWLQANLRAPRGRADIRRVPLRQVAAEWLHPLRLRESPELESARDPLPGLVGWREFFAELAGDIRGRLGGLRDRRLAKRLVRRMRQDREAVSARLRAARSVLFVCVGNINRSALAKQALEDRCSESDRRLTIAAAGTLDRPGRSTSGLSLQVAHRLGVDLSKHRSTTLSVETLRASDVIFVMDADQLGTIRQLDPESLQRTYLLGGLAPDAGGTEIPDPFGERQAEFEKVYRRILCCVETLAEALSAERDKATRESKLAM